VNVLIAQSGGPTPVINMSLMGAVQQAVKLKNIKHVYASRNGIEGLLNDQVIQLEGRLAELESASHQPGSVLGASHYPVAEGDFERVIERLEQLEVDIFCYIGGNGSSRMVKALHHLAAAQGKSMRFVHVPKTIDNDLLATDHTPGFASASKLLANMIQWIGMDMTAMKAYDKVGIVEVMGGNAGWLAAASALGKQNESAFPQVVYQPKAPVDVEHFLETVDRAYRDYGQVMIVVPDHIKFRDLQADQAGNQHLRNNLNAGISSNLAGLVRQHFGLKTRVTAPGVLYRCASAMVSECDREEAYRLGAEAIRMASEGMSGGMVGLHRVSNDPYHCTIKWVDLDEVAGKERYLPQEFWDEERQMPTAAFRAYMEPLLGGQVLQPVLL